MKYQVSKKGSSVTFKFETYEEAVDFCNTMIFFGKCKRRRISRTYNK
jgi:hypothetical protein